MEKYFSVNRVIQEAPFVKLAVTTKEVDAKSIDDLFHIPLYTLLIQLNLPTLTAYGNV